MEMPRQSCSTLPGHATAPLVGGLLPSTPLDKPPAAVDAFKPPMMVPRIPVMMPLRTQRDALSPLHAKVGGMQLVPFQVQP